MPRRSELTGKRFGRLVAAECAGKPNGRNYSWSCLCDCGTSAIVRGANLTSGNTQSCGCLNRERSREAATKHGEWRKHERIVWTAMLQRCSNPSNHSYRNYGSRGIKVCERWLDYGNFLADMGRRPSPKHSIDRIDNNGNYEPENCRWATKQEQMRNARTTRFISHKGQTMCLTDWAQQLSMRTNALSWRLLNWSLDDALTKPKRRSNSHA